MQLLNAETVELRRQCCVGVAVGRRRRNQLGIGRLVLDDGGGVLRAALHVRPGVVHGFFLLKEQLKKQRHGDFEGRDGCVPTHTHTHTRTVQRSAVGRQKGRQHGGNHGNGILAVKISCSRTVRL